jgi:3'(2'), 5'-bisphosphate nucleotidase
MNPNALLAACAEHLPAVVRWAGGIAKVLRRFDVAVDGKTSGSSNTDALTLADLSLQELLVAALRDTSPLFRECRIEAEERTGDLDRFPTTGEYTISIDPIDGTKQFRDRSGDGWAVMIHLRTAADVLYSLVHVPETGEHGTWLEVHGDEVRCGPDDPDRPARDVLDALAPITAATRPESRRFYVIGFQDRDPEVAEEILPTIGLDGHTAETMPGSIYPLLATGAYGGSLIHSPNVYDYPVALHVARALGGDSVWVHTGEPVHFRETWNDDRADMLRLPGIVATATDRRWLPKLCDLARDWSQRRYA